MLVLCFREIMKKTILIFLCLTFSVLPESLLLKEYSFEKADLNSDGRITPDEAKVVAGGREGYKMAFTLIDEDGNFEIDEREFELFLYQLEEYKKSKNIEDIQKKLGQIK